MKKLYFLSIFLIQILFASGQKSDIIGLYGECDEYYGGYVCQQFQLLDDSTFIFYDFLHLRGWVLSKGKWSIKNDTIILNSKNPLERPQYDLCGKNNYDSLNIYVYSDEGALPFVNVGIDTNSYTTNFKGLTKIPKIKNEKFYISYVGFMREYFKFEQDFINSDTLKVRLFSGMNVGTLFLNEKWLIKDDKIFHTPDSTNNFDSSGYFIKVPMIELNYREDY